MKKCEICGTSMSDDVTVCHVCGAAVRNEQAAVVESRTCPACGASVGIAKKYCPQCGAVIHADNKRTKTHTPKNEENKPVEAPTVETATVDTADRTAENKICPTCGASVAAGKKFCPQCGGKVSDVNKPAEEKHVEQPKEHAADKTAEKKICSTCGASVAAGKKFCNNCGAKMPVEQRPEEEKFAVGQRPVEQRSVEQRPVEPTVNAGNVLICQTCGADVAAGKKFCTNCGAKMPEQQSSPAVQKLAINFCPECGAHIDGDKKFCPTCGAPLTPNTASASSAASGGRYAPTGRAATTAGKIRQILPTAGIWVTLVMTFIFMFVPFLSATASVMGYSSKTSQAGVTGLAVLFTGRSELGTDGVSEAVMRLCGAGYILLILALVWYILFAISSIYKYDRKTLDRQLILGVVLTVISLLLAVLSIIARVQMTDAINNMLGMIGVDISSIVDIDWFMGGVALFAVNMVMLIYAVAMRVIYDAELDRPALTPNLLGVKASRVLTFIDALVIIVCIVVPVALGCSGGVAKQPSKADEIQAAGSITIRCEDTINGNVSTLYYGVAYFVYTPKSDGMIGIDIESSSSTELSAVTVGIFEYDEVYDIYRAEGNEGVMMELSGYEYDECTVQAGVKYCIVFGAASLSKNDKINISYRFDDGGTSSVGNIGGDQPDNSTRQNATSVSLGASTATGVISSGDSKWYKFSPSVSGDYRISTITCSGDPDLYIYNSISANSSIVSDMNGGGFNKTFTALAGSTYYIEIKSYSGTSSCSFSIVRVDSSGDGSSRDSAILLENGKYVSTGTISSQGSKWYKFTPSLSGTHRIASTVHTGDPDLIVFDSLYYSSKLAEDIDSGGFDLQLNLTAGTTYYIQIYAIGQSSCTFCVDDNYSERDRAIEITTLDTPNSVGLYVGEYRWYKYTPSLSDTYTVNIGDVYLATVNTKVYEGESEIWSGYASANNDYSIPLDMTAGTTYYFQLYINPDYISTSCTIAIVRGNANSPRASAESIELDSEITIEQISLDGSWYKFTPIDTGSYVVRMITYSVDPDIMIYEGINSTYPSASDTSLGWQDLRYTMTAYKTYYIQIFYSGSCTFMLSKVPDTYQARSAAVTLYQNFDNITGTISVNDSKWYKLTPSSSTTYWIKTSTCTGDPHLYIYDSIWSNTAIVSDTSTDSIGFNKAVDLEGNHTYYVRIHANATTSSCTFKFAPTSTESGGGSTQSTAAELVAGASYYVASIGEGDSVWFKFVAQSTTEFRFYTTTYSGDPDLYVYDGNDLASGGYIELLKSDTSVGDFNCSGVFTPGTYYIVLRAKDSGASCQFSFV